MKMFSPQGDEDIFPCYFLEVIALIFAFKSIIHLELIFEYAVRWRSIRQPVNPAPFF